MADLIRRLVDQPIAAIDTPFAVISAELISQPVSSACRKMLEAMQEKCPDLLPDIPLKEGQISAPIEVEAKLFLKLTKTAIKPNTKKAIIWRENGSEVRFWPDKTVVDIQEGLILIGIVLEAQETGEQTLTVPFATGTEKRFAGTVMTTDQKPRGNERLINIWGDAVIAAAYEAVLQVVSGIAAETGIDTKGQNLRVGAIIAKQGILSVIPQAYFDFENKILNQNQPVVSVSHLAQESREQ